MEPSSPRPLRSVPSSASSESNFEPEKTALESSRATIPPLLSSVGLETFQFPPRSAAEQKIEPTQSRKPVALAVDDRREHLELTAAALRLQGYDVQTAMSLSEAREAVIRQRDHGGFDKIVSDYDYGSTLWTKYRMFDGFRFLKWCIEQEGIAPDRLSLHSTVFESWQRLGLWFHGSFLGIIPHARELGITVRPKSDLIGNTIYKKR